MNKYKEAIKELTDLVHSELDGTKMLNEYIGYIETIKEFVDKAYSNCFPVYVNGTCPYHNQNIPTLEQVQKEWEALGYKWKEDEIFITLIKQKYSKGIKINKKLKDYKCYDLFMTPTLLHSNNIALFITFQEHQLLTKTFKALGWL